MKTRELTGALLDYWVAKADGKKAKIHCGYCFLNGDHRSEWTNDQGGFRPSTDWVNGGKIIERERIGTSFEEVAGLWHAEFEHAALSDGVQRTFTSGSTTLIAAMRAYVASKFGDEVPKEIS